MRVLHLLGAREDTGGILSVIRTIAEATRDKGCSHAVWVNRRYAERRSPALQYRYSRHLISESDRHVWLFLKAALALPELQRLLAREPYDAFHAHSRGALVVACLAAEFWRRPVLFTNHAYARRLGLYRWASRRRWMLTAVLSANMSRHYGIPVDGRKVMEVSECCADRFFDGPLVTRRDRAEGGPLRLVGLGSVERWKKWHLVIEALGLLHPDERRCIEFHHFGLVPEHGEAYHRELLQELVQSSGAIHCTFHGLSLSVEERLRDADCFLLPSTNEPCSVALIEALAMGLPALVSASGGNVDIIRPEQTGLLFEPDDAASLAAQMRRLLLGQVAFVDPAGVRSSVRSRGAARVAGQYLELYRRLSRRDVSMPSQANR